MKKKILLIYSYFGTNKGSYSTRLYEFSKYWVEKGYSVEVITAPHHKTDIKTNRLVETKHVDGVKVTLINTPDNNKNSFFLRTLNTLLFSVISSFLSLFRTYDIILCSSGPISVGIPLIISRLFKSKKIIFEVRDLWPSGGVQFGIFKNKLLIYFLFLFEELLYNCSHAIVTLSIGQKKDIISRFPRFENKIYVITQISNNELYDSIEINIDYKSRYGNMLVHVGGIGPIHNVGYWIEIALELNKLVNNYSFIFIGDGPQRKELENKTKYLGLRNIYFLGSMNKKMVVPWFKSSYAALFSTTAHPVQQTCSPNKLFDSFAAGVPVIQTSTGWIKDEIQNENCGISLDLHNIKESAQSIFNFLNDVKLRNEYSLNSKKLAVKKYDKKTLANKYISIFNS